MKPDIFEQSYKSSIRIIEAMELAENDKNELLKLINDLQYQYNRSNNYYKFNIEALEEEKKILLKNFMKKDQDVTYLYNKIQEYEKSTFYKLFKKFKNNDK